MINQAGQLLNAILQDLCQDYDLEAARKTTILTLTPTATAVGSPLPLGSGPYALPTDYLRARKGMVFYTFQGVPYFMVPMDLSEYDALVQQQGFNDFPRDFTTDMAVSPPNLFVWPPTSITTPMTVRYYSQMADIGLGAYGASDNQPPQTSTVVPWFPNTNYLVTRLAGEMMKIADDSRCESFLSSDADRCPGGAGSILRHYLQMKDDPEGKTNVVKLDRRLFGTNFSRLPNTKLIGWVVLLNLVGWDILWQVIGGLPWIS